MRTMTLFCILALLGGFAVALEDASLSASHQQRPDFPIGPGPQGKRAYSYVSEYKRLPIYNFGLGKRRSGPPPPDDRDASENERTRFYTFGLGKQSHLSDARPLSSGRVPEPSYESYPRDEDYSYLANKRGGHRLYSFGIGKRPSNENIGRRFLFGLGKRDAEEEEEEAAADV